MQPIHQQSILASTMLIASMNGISAEASSCNGAGKHLKVVRFRNHWTKYPPNQTYAEHVFWWRNYVVHTSLKVDIQAPMWPHARHLFLEAH